MLGSNHNAPAVRSALLNGTEAATTSAMGHHSEIVDLDRSYVWHPFTPFATWLSPDYEPTVIASGKGSLLRDDRGNEFLDGNSSIWVNLHGHRNPAIDRAIRAQLKKIAHSSFLGLTNDIAPQFAKELAEYCRHPSSDADGSPPLARVSFSDNGSTAIETAIKVVFRHFALVGQPRRSKFVSLGSGYHGDTVGAMSVGHSDSFHGVYQGLQFDSAEAMMPYCYRCPFNRAAPERRDAREYRKCGFECAREFQKTVDACGDAFAGTAIEPLVQGSAGMVMHPHGYLAEVSKITKAAGGKLILDEVMTGFCRTGHPMAFHAEDCRPDAVALAKGMTAGYLPCAATLFTDELVSAFVGGPEKTFYHGHSYSGNQLGCAAARANLGLLKRPGFLEGLAKKIQTLSRASKIFWKHENVGDVRQSGMVLAVEIVEDWRTRRPFPKDLRMGWKISEAAKKFGLLTRPIGDVLVIMPPLSTSAKDIRRIVKILDATIGKTFPEK